MSTVEVPERVTGVQIVAVEHLTIADQRGDRVLDDVSFSVPEHGAHALVGSSGSGKTTAALAVVGRIGRGLRHIGGTVNVAGAQPLTEQGARLRALRREFVYVGQDPGSELTPTMTVGALLDETKAPGIALADVLTSVDLPADPDFSSRHPHQLSGGQRRRVALARALASRPRMLLVDEPTAGLDPDTLAQVVGAIGAARRTFDVSLVIITHDLDAARELTGTVSVLDGGRVVESGATRDVFGAPASASLRAIVRAEAAVREERPSDPVADGAAVLNLDRVTVGQGSSPVPLFGPLDLSLSPGEAVGLVGPSGVGKSTLARAIVGLHPVLSGTVSVGGSEPVARPRRRPPPVALVPQDPDTSLNPALPVQTSIARSLPGRHDRANRVAELLRQVDLEPAIADRRPAHLSGGQRQRVALARALAGRPRVLLCDEITSALDTVTEGRVLDMLDDLRQRYGLALVVITHSEAVANRLCHRIIELRTPS